MMTTTQDMNTVLRMSVIERPLASNTSNTRSGKVINHWM